jgi:hypothetical protein
MKKEAVSPYSLLNYYFAKLHHLGNPTLERKSNAYGQGAWRGKMMRLRHIGPAFA